MKLVAVVLFTLYLHITVLKSCNWENIKGLCMLDLPRLSAPRPQDCNCVPSPSSAVPLFLKAHVEAGDACASGRYTSSGECCSLCPAGTGVVSGCAEDDTKCQPCQEGTTFSDSEGLFGCQPCSRCPVGIPQLARCTITQDTRCDCGKGFFLSKQMNDSDAICTPCDMCRQGEGVVRECGPAGNTVCQPCGPGTFSEEKKHSNACMPCSHCQEDEVEIRPCQPKSDTLCMDLELHIFSRNGSEGPWEFPRRPVSPDDERKNRMVTVSEGPNTGSEHHEGGGNNILIYVSVLAAVVLGLLIYVAYKCWKSFQQKAALGKGRAAELNNVVEGEKLHSDSGVFLDSHSLQDSQPGKGIKLDSKQDPRYIDLPPHRQEEVEKLLTEGGSQNWRQLANVLGYEQDRVDMFGRGEDPIHTLLTDWAQQDSATLELLASALSNIERHDVAKALSSPNQGITMV
ncbi:Tumor necrosis factor receptor superfamily member 16 [Bagarius yarrelli]|uniref:Tumor necrosis factor receptor superfamily member 16 n=1 Tax=Bagarius yarrelli TaxID=175774 RepID=A0A556VAN1_BAGYA|nr:Tumor necrosis factor receptor superfamily member 16 [Bagarius yarrelli]